ncbi:hypothetical protein [Nonomuraea sp. NPDC023979]|uniref:hypothetical protein n=1 Tax=Nonomuraea sp. NPDC023979 TaxID=3154796 RepID=UPI0033DAF6CA
MSKGSRVRRRRADTISLVFCDLDFDRASRPFGRGTNPIPPSGWAMARAGLVYAEWDGRRCQITGNELIEGRHPASLLVAVLREHPQRLIVGHGLLRSDLTAVAMVTDVPDAVIRRSVDTLELAHRLRGGRRSTGCNLSDVAWETLGLRRRKPTVPDRLAGGGAVTRGDHDPREDAALVARLWGEMVTARTLSWGTGAPSGRPGTATLAVEHLAELTGRQPQPETEHYRRCLSADPPGRLLDESKSRVLRTIAADLPNPIIIRDVAERLQAAGLVPTGPLSDEELLTACQWMGYRQNLDVRDRIARGRPLTKALRYRLGQALWEMTHPSFVSTIHQARHRSQMSALAFIELQQLLQEQNRIRAMVADAVDPA